MLGQVTNAKNLGLPDMSFREIAIFVPLIAWSVWIGVYPKPYFDVLRRPVAEIVQRVRPEYYAAVPPPVSAGGVLASVEKIPPAKTGGGTGGGAQ
jgi:NADH-quinone oxidoreductase subunit M